MSPEERIDELSAEVARLREAARTPEQRSRDAAGSLDDAIRRAAGRGPAVATPEDDVAPTSFDGGARSAPPSAPSADQLLRAQVARNRDLSAYLRAEGVGAG